MANRIALRELQNRLAVRLQAARSQQQSVSWLAVESGLARYLFPLTQAAEIFACAPIQLVPYARNWFLGVANLRGGLYGVVNLTRFVGGGAEPDTKTPGVGESTAVAAAGARMITLNPALDVNCAMLIDRLAGLRGMESFETSHQAPAGSPDYFGHQYIDAQQVEWQELNLQSLVKSPRFLEISV